MLKNNFHELVDTTEYKELLGRIDLTGKSVIEIGVGTGALTKLVLEGNPKEVIGYEIDPSLCKISDSRLSLHIRDFTMAPMQSLTGTHCLISNPPYNLLPFIRRWIDSNPLLVDIILMVGGHYRALFPEFTEEFKLDGRAFDPPAKGDHIVLKKGFI